MVAHRAARQVRPPARSQRPAVRPGNAPRRPNRKGVSSTITHEPGLAPADLHFDPIEYYTDQAWGDGLPIVPPTPAKVAATVAALGGEPEFAEAVVPPRRG